MRSINWKEVRLLADHRKQLGVPLHQGSDLYTQSRQDYGQGREVEGARTNIVTCTSEFSEYTNLLIIIRGRLNLQPTSSLWRWSSIRMPETIRIKWFCQDTISYWISSFLLIQLLSVTHTPVKIMEHVNFQDPILNVLVSLVTLEIDAKVSDTTTLCDCFWVLVKVFETRKFKFHLLSNFEI